MGVLYKLPTKQRNTNKINNLKNGVSQERNMLLHVMIMCLFTIGALGTLQGSNSSSMSKPGCPTKCGNVTVPYPFGIGEDCSLNDGFTLTCEMSEKTPFLYSISVGERIHSISDSELRIPAFVTYSCYQQDGTQIFGSGLVQDLEGPFAFSEKNKLTVIGCDDYGLITGKDGDYFSSGCIGLCDKALEVPDGQCSGQGCCQTSITKGLKHYEVRLKTFRNHTDVWSFNMCGYAFLAEEGSFQFHGIRNWVIARSNASVVVKRIQSTVPVVLDWVINGSCTKATECRENSHCYPVEGGGYRCRCNKGYQGNAYLEQGCQDINECENPQIYRSCNGDCINTIGGYYCSDTN